jgi:Cu-processing system permease protein
MTVVVRLIGFGLRDLIRNRWTIVYALFFLAACEGLLRMIGEPVRAIASLMQLVLFVVPLVSLLFGAMHVYNSREFVRLLLAQPIHRTAVYLSQYLSLSLSLGVGFALGVILPVAMRGGAIGDTGTAYLLLLVTGLFLTFIFVGIAFLISMSVKDKGKGVALSLLTWLTAAILYDGAVLLLAHIFSDWPLEKPLIAATLLNPIDLARILMLIQLDFSALMGYTGAVFERFFGHGVGATVAVLSLLLWTAIPLSTGIFRFSRKDL